MSFVSSSFLFLFLPISVLVYHLIPAGKKFYCKNLFLVLISLFFYTWGEPCYVFLLLLLTILVYFAGRLLEGKQGTVFGRIIIAFTAALGIGVIVFFRLRSGKGAPLGTSFFVFFAVSYVVDIYREKCKPSQNFLYTALYLSAFFKVTQGPIIEYHQFRSQMENRVTDRDMIYRGIKRFLVGFAKKAIIASGISGIATVLFSDGIEECSVVCAWIGCIACLVNTYIDFSAYSDMACGLGLLFGFRLPENFNYPYMAHSVTEYWQRWHITLIQWFKDYLYYPITLGPAVRFRKFLLKHKVKKETAKKLQNIFVPACVWIPTALWHGASVNFVLWGVLNCLVCILEMNRKPSKKANPKRVGGWLHTICFLMLMTPLVLFEKAGSSLTYYGAMFGIGHHAFTDDMTWFLLKEYGAFIAIGLFFCFPFRKRIKDFFRNRLGDKVTEIAEDTALLLLSVVSVAYAVKTGSSFFIYQMY